MKEFILWKQKYIHHLELQRGLSQNSLRAIQKDLEQFLNYMEEYQDGELTVLTLKSYFFIYKKSMQAIRYREKFLLLRSFFVFKRRKYCARRLLSLLYKSSKGRRYYFILKKMYGSNFVESLKIIFEIKQFLNYYIQQE